MTTKEAIVELAKRGVKISAWKLRGMIERSEIPRPRLDSSLSFDWTQNDLTNVLIATRQPEAAAV